MGFRCSMMIKAKNIMKELAGMDMLCSGQDGYAHTEHHDY